MRNYNWEIGAIDRHFHPIFETGPQFTWPDLAAPLFAAGGRLWKGRGMDATQRGIHKDVR